MSHWTLQDAELDTTGVHAALLPTGAVLYFSYDADDENNVDRSKWQTWSESAGPSTPAATILQRNLFCAGHCWLGNGRLLVAAGQSWNFASSVRGADHDIHTFDPFTLEWTRHRDMPSARYYPTCVTLQNGNALILGGAWTRVPASHVNHEAEVFDWRSSRLTAPFPFNPGFIEQLYPFAQLMPDGTAEGLLWVHSGERARLYSPALREWLPPTFTTITAGNRNYPKQGAGVMLPLTASDGFRTRILLVGGGSTSEDAAETAQVFEFDRSTPEQSFYRNPVGNQPSFRRFMSDAVLLADGTVLICGGAGRGSADHSHDPVMDCELFDPVTETFRVDSRIHHARMYHSSAILLPSGRVALAGNTVHWNPGNPLEDESVEVYTPDYLLRGDQPVLTSAPATVAYAEVVELESADALRTARVAFVRCGTVTHTNNMDQRWVELPIVSRSQDRLSVQMPFERPFCPPGRYMFFLLDSEGVPSHARFTFLDPARRPDLRGCRFWP